MLWRSWSSEIAGSWEGVRAPGSRSNHLKKTFTVHENDVMQGGIRSDRALVRLFCLENEVYSSSSPSSSSNSTLKNLNSYTPLEVEITRNQSRSYKLAINPTDEDTDSFLRNFLVRYFKYRPLNFAPFATTAIFPSSREIVMLSPKFPVRLSTLILSWRNFSKADVSKILSFAGAVASSTYCKS